MKLSKFGIILPILILSGCLSIPTTDNESPRLVASHGGYPYITEYDGAYYFLMQGVPANTIKIFSSCSLDSISDTDGVLILDGVQNGMSNIWSPEMCRIKDKWYIYFEADDGNTDNHQLYVLENENINPTHGKWTMHGPIITDSNWNYGIHPAPIIHEGRQYLLWSGWKQRRTETETQCIFIAEMENPWTLKSERSLISQPDHEWERQWINPDGTRTAYPIFVNENPEPFLSPDGKRLMVAYSASGIWTPYHYLGLLYASSDSNLLDPKSWTKIEEPQFIASVGQFEGVFGTSNVSVINPTDGTKTRILFEAKEKVEDHIETKIYMKAIEWDEKSLPVFGSPF